MEKEKKIDLVVHFLTLEYSQFRRNFTLLLLFFQSKAKLELYQGLYLYYAAVKTICMPYS